MAQSNIPVTSGTGNRVDTFTTTTQANQRQAVVIADPAVDANTTPVHATLGAGINVLGVGSTALALGQTTMSASVPVVIASNQSDVFGAATGAAVPANAGYEAGIAKTALPTAATDGNLTGLMTDKFGRQVQITQTIRDLVTDATVTISASTSETTILAAVASTFLDVTAVMVANTSATGARVDFRDATTGTVRFSLWVPPTETRGIVFQVPRPQTTANNNWTAQSSASITDLRIYLQAIKNL